MLSEELPLTPEEIRKLIKASGHDQKEVAEQLKLSETTVSKWVTGHGRPSRDNEDKLRALKPRPTFIREWNTYMAEAKGRVIANRQAPLPSEPTAPPPTVDSEALAESVAARVRDSVAEALKASSGEVVAAVKACAGEVETFRATMATASEVAEAVKAKVGTPSEVAAHVKASMPTAQEVAAEVNASTPKPADEATVAALVTRYAGPFLKVAKLSAAITVSSVVVGMAIIVALVWRTADLRMFAKGSLPWPARSTPDDAADGNEAMGTARKDSIPMPTKPYEWQRLAPCGRGEFEQIGGCWVRAEAGPPCPDLAVEDQGRCLIPVPAKPKRPNSVTTEHK